MNDHIDTILAEWTAAELAGDKDKLESLLADDFYGVGPWGFVLQKPAWLERFDQGLAYEAFELSEILLRDYRGVTLVTARNDTRGSYRGQPVPESSRATIVIAADSETWRLGAIHISFIAGTVGAPNFPGPAQRSAGETSGEQK
jgi:Domain of unknown function (DUF4440)